MNVFEHSIDSFVFVTSFPPSFNNTGVVTVNDDVVPNARESGEGIDQQFKTNGFCPGDILFVPSCSLAPKYQSPGIPPLTNDDANAYARTSI